MNRSFTSLACGIVLAGAFLAPGPALAWQNAQQPADNTKVNTRDRKSSEPTADQGKNNLSDRELMRQIRQSVVKDKSLSTYGHNVKIISEHGKVTLKGPVHSEEEKKAIDYHARRYAGDSNVENQISVKTDNK